MGEKCYKVPFLERFKIKLFTTYKCTLYDDVGLACPALIIVWKNKTECRVHCKADQFLRGNGHQLVIKTGVKENWMMSSAKHD